MAPAGCCREKLFWISYYSESLIPQSFQQVLPDSEHPLALANSEFFLIWYLSTSLELASRRVVLVQNLRTQLELRAAWLWLYGFTVSWLSSFSCSRCIFVGWQSLPLAIFKGFICVLAISEYKVYVKEITACIIYSMILINLIYYVKVPVMPYQAS